MHFIHAGPLCITRQVVHLTTYSAVGNNPAQEKVPLKLCALWPWRVELTCAFDPLGQQSVLLHFHSFSLMSKDPTHLNSLKNSLEMHGTQKKSGAKSRRDMKLQASSWLGLKAILFTSCVCTDHLGTPAVFFRALQP